MSFVASNESGYVSALMQVERLTRTALAIYGAGSVIACSVDVDDGYLDGKAVCTRQDGSKAMRVDLRQGRIDGKVEIYNPNAATPVLSFFIEDGKLEGPMQYRFRDSKQISVEARASAGVWDGKYAAYTAKGKLLSEGTFRQGKQVGKWVDYWPNTRRARTKMQFDDSGQMVSNEKFDEDGKAL